MPLSRTGWVLTGTSVVLVAAIGPAVPTLAGDVVGPSFPDALVAGASLLALALAACSLAVTAMLLVGGSSRLVAAITPAFLRRALLAGAAGALVVAPAHAGQRTVPDPLQHSVHGLPLPDRPDVARQASQASPVPATSSVEVTAGDTLWALAAHHLPSGATPAEIASATSAWHAANRDVIGDDPDLIHPGQRLTPPDGKDHP